MECNEKHYPAGTQKIKVFREDPSDVDFCHPLKDHPRILALRVFVSTINVDARYRKRLYSSIWKYADQFIDRPVYNLDEGWSDEEALQQVTLGDMNEEYLQEMFEADFKPAP